MIRDIVVLNPAETTLFAAAELVRCLRIMANPAASFRVRVSDALPKAGIALALADDPRVAGCCEAIARSEEDDAVSVAILEGSGVIVGANERSLLIGVYRLLQHLGCRWVRPGVEGEFLPSRDVSRLSATFVEKASLRHRALCIEGAVSVENVLAMVDWAPKVGFSGYFIQFTDGYTFFNRWYSHVGNDSRTPEPFSKEAARAYTIQIEEAIRKRGMTYHSAGHGWTCKAIGVDATHWDPISVPLDDRTRGLLAKVDGRRDLRWDRPMLTSLCFSREEVKTRMVDAVVAHAAAHPEVDLLHVWLDDGGKNKCECENCAKSLPADEYVAILRRLDAALTAAGSRVRIVFIAYADLLWPPSKGTPPLDPERFVFLYANSRRDYAKTLQAKGPAAMPAYVRNHYGATNGPDAFRGFLQGWQAFFPDGDKLLFEYYGCGPLNQYDLARVVHADAAALAPLGLNGLVNCHAQRVFLPTGLPCYVLGMSLWNTQQDLDALRDDYFLAAFGQDGGACKEFIKVSAEVLGRVVKFEQTLELQPEAPAQLEKLRRMILEFERVVARNAARPDPCQARSWYYMERFARLLRELAGLFGVVATGDRAAVLVKWREVRRFIEALERDCQPVFDLWAFVRPYDRYLTAGRFSNEPQDVVQE